MWPLFCLYLILIIPSFGNLGGLFCVIVAFPVYLHISIWSLASACTASVCTTSVCTNFVRTKYIWAIKWENVPSNTYVQWGLKSIFIARMKKLCILDYQKSAQGRFWSACSFAQSDQNLPWALMSESTLSDMAAHMIECRTNSVKEAQEKPNQLSPYMRHLLPNDTRWWPKYHVEFSDQEVKVCKGSG